MSEMTPVQVCITRMFNASAERVFDAWLDTQSLSKWMFGPSARDEEIVRLTNDPRVGGKFSFAVRRQGQLVDHVGEYLAIDRPHRLAFTWGIAGSDSSRVDIEITRLANGCELVLTHALHPDWADFAPRTQQGWTHMLEKLPSVLSTG